MDVLSPADELRKEVASDSTWQNVVWKLEPGTPVGRALNSATRRLNSTDNSAAGLDAQVLLAHVLGKERVWLFAHHEYTLSEEEAEVFTELVVRRIAHEPVAYLIGRQEFYNLSLMVDQRVLIPRPETEHLVDKVLDFVEFFGEKTINVADIGTGSGAIALAVAANAPNTSVYAVDFSEDALDVAERNVNAMGMSDRVTLSYGDLLSSLREKMHVIIANLPYINSHDLAQLDPDVRDFEPHFALHGGQDGLDTIRRLLQQIPDYIAAGGRIFLEIAYDQGAAVVQLAKEMLPDARAVDLYQDYSGLDRIVVVAM